MTRRRLMSVLLAVVVLICAGVMLYSPIRLRLVVALGLGKGCTVERALEAPTNSERIRRVKDRILSASKKIAQEGPYAQWSTPDGLYWIPVRNQYTLPFNLAEQKLDIYSLGPVHIKPSDVVMDCGANVGVYTRKALNAGAKLIIAIEPAPENIEVLERNFATEIRQGRVIVYPKGVWDKEDTLILHENSDDSAADSFVINLERDKKTAHASDEKLPVTTIDHIVAELGLDRVDFIKMDIEGAEVRAVRGAQKTIARDHPRMALTAYHRPSDPIELPKAVHAAWGGYTMLCGPCAALGWRVRPDVLLFY